MCLERHPISGYLERNPISGYDEHPIATVSYMMECVIIDLWMESRILQEILRASDLGKELQVSLIMLYIGKKSQERYKVGGCIFVERRYVILNRKYIYSQLFDILYFF